MAAICSAFSTTPDVAAVLRGARWRRTTIAVMDVMHASRLRAEFDAKQTKGWTQGDHTFWRDMLEAGGFEQPPLDGGLDERSD
jgi:hypothetical protein